ncbi:MAG: [FeFe] hydrogenase H-cluster radical SAM maturase HydE [Candidatus Gygaella obscura]|nr:[FeFe] hydrogenase H-cluster radical SAM maturase HydE [Candidatus Gygaella obscura]
MDKSEILTYLTKTPFDELVNAANSLRKKHIGEKVYIRAIVEFSNYCVRNCLYCGLRKDSKQIDRYRMVSDEISSVVKKITKINLRTVVLQSGDDFYYTKKKICTIIEAIKSADSDIAITLSIGERPFSEYVAFRKLGADRFLLKHETINSSLYAKLHPSQNLKRRIKTIEYLRKIGFQVGIGNIIGLPGQTLEDLADDIIFMQDFQPDMIGIGPFLPQKYTPLNKHVFKNIDLVLRVIALARIVTKDSHIPATTAMATAKKNGQLSALGVGANVIMVDFTPSKYRKNYRIYDDKIKISLKKAEETIREAGRVMSYARGDSLKNE